MFVNKYRLSEDRIFRSPQRHQMKGKLGQVLKKISTPEIKKHEKKNYFNARTFLIESTKKVIKTPVKQSKQIMQTRHSMPSQEMIYEMNAEHRKTNTDLSNREARHEAAKNFRQRIWKSSDITSLVKASQEKNCENKKSPNSREKQFYGCSQQKIERYHDCLQKMEGETDVQLKQRIKRQWLDGAIKNSTSLKPSQINRNPQQLQIANISFNCQLDSLNSSKLLINRDRRKQMRRMHIFNFTQLDRRPNTTGGLNRLRSDDNQGIIEPW